ncbi:unnamed protein product, partial [Rotaria magnacalcarata]
VCVNGWQGVDCRASSCGPHGLICHNGASCILNSNSAYVCQCKHLWSGPTCEQRL